MSSPEVSGLILFAAFAVAVLVGVNARGIGEWLDVMANPDLERKRHAMTIPQVGGIAILLALGVWLGGTLLFSAHEDRPLLLTLLFCALGVGLIGLADDQRDTPPLSRTLGLLVFVGIALVIDPNLIAKTFNWGSFDPVPIPLWLYCIVLGLAAVGLVNAVNMADGQDGIVGSMYVVWAGCLMIVEHGTSEVIAGVLLMASVIFLSFNLRGKLFLGDCGSYGVTFAFGLLATLAHARGEISLETLIVWFFVPGMDCLRLLISRPLRKRSPFQGDRDHFHHRLEDKMGKNLSFVTYAAIVALSSLIATLEPKFTLVCLSALSAVYFSFAWLTNANPVPAEQTETGDNVISFAASTNFEPHSRESA